MSILETGLMAVSLAMDCFSVSITSGIIMRRICWRTFLLMAFCFGFFQAFMPVLGWIGASQFYGLIKDVDHWIAFGLLFFLGVKMIRESMEEDHPEFDPTCLKIILTLAVATSIDALAVGIYFGCIGMDTASDIFLPIVIIGMVSFAFSILGCLIGVFCGKRINLRAEMWAGIILICIGLKILIEHLELFEL